MARRSSTAEAAGEALEAACARALAGRRGAVFTPREESRILAAFALAHAAERAGGPPVAEALAALLSGRRSTRLGRALDGLAVVDPACGGGALLAMAGRLAAPHGARLRLHGLDVARVAVETTRARLALVGLEGEIRRGDATAARWPAADLLLGNPPFLRHEALGAALKSRAVRRSGLPRQADLSAHLAAMALRHAPVVGLVLPRALEGARSAAPLHAEAAARGGFVLRLRSHAGGSFAASVDTVLTVWVAGGKAQPPVEASAPLAELSDAELLALARRRPPRRIRGVQRHAPPPASVPLSSLAEVRFGLKSGCNGFFHLEALGGGRYRSALLGEVRLRPGDLVPLLCSLKEVRAPERCQPARLLFRPAGEPSPEGHDYLARGEAAGVAERPSCAGRSPWWRLSPHRGPAPLLYPAKLGARAFAVLNVGGLFEDKKWHALFPHPGMPAWLLGVALSSTPVRLGIDEGARQLTGAQAIADVDCRVLAAAPVPRLEALLALEAPLAELRLALATDEVTTDLAAMLARPAAVELDRLVGGALGLDAGEVERRRDGLVARVAARQAHGLAVRARVARG